MFISFLFAGISVVLALISAGLNLNRADNAKAAKKLALRILPHLAWASVLFALFFFPVGRVY